MADILQFSRETKLFVEIGSDIWEIPVLDGFSFSQATNSTEVALNEMASTAGVSRRGRRQFSDSVAPAEFSFSTYTRPVAGATGGGASQLGAVEEVLWACFCANNPVFTAGTGTGRGEWSQAIDKTTQDTVAIDFDSSNYTTLKEFTLYFVLGACSDTTDITYTRDEGHTIYKIAGSVLNTATINFDIDGISMIEWAGFGGVMTQEETWDSTGSISTGADQTGNLIRNRLTTLAVAPSAGMVTTGFETAYDMVLTGGSIEFNNNITFLTPETLCIVNKPLGHVTGTRSISGNFTNYLVEDLTNDDDSSNLWVDMQLYNTEVVTDFDVTFVIGGTGNDPRLTINLDQCHFEIPQHATEDVISVDTTFHALPTTLDATDEATLEYYTTITT